MKINLIIPSSSDDWIRSRQTMLIDLTTFPVDAALVEAQTDEPLPGDWSAATWSGDDIRWHYTGGLPKGVYGFWIRVNAIASQPVRLTGLVRLTG